MVTNLPFSHRSFRHDTFLSGKAQRANLRCALLELFYGLDNLR
jgi:hypothetical protein